MDATGQARPRRRRPPTRGLLFGAPLDRLPTSPSGRGVAPSPRPEPVPIALIGESTPVAPPRVAAYGAMAATWPLVDRRTAADPAGSTRPSGPSSVALPDRHEHACGPGDGVERRGGGLSTQEWHRLLGR